MTILFTLVRWAFLAVWLRFGFPFPAPVPALAVLYPVAVLSLLAGTLNRRHRHLELALTSLATLLLGGLAPALSMTFALADYRRQLAPSPERLRPEPLAPAAPDFQDVSLSNLKPGLTRAQVERRLDGRALEATVTWDHEGRLVEIQTDRASLMRGGCDLNRERLGPPERTDGATELWYGGRLRIQGRLVTLSSRAREGPFPDKLPFPDRTELPGRGAPVTSPEGLMLDGLRLGMTEAEAEAVWGGFELYCPYGERAIGGHLQVRLGACCDSSGHLSGIGQGRLLTLDGEVVAGAGATYEEIVARLGPSTGVTNQIYQTWFEGRLAMNFSNTRFRGEVRRCASRIFLNA